MNYGGYFDFEKRNAKIKELETKTLENGFWDNRRESTKIINELNANKNIIKEAEELKNMDFQTAWTHTLKNAEFATSFVELLQEMLTGMDADDVIVSIDDLVDSVGGN